MDRFQALAVFTKVVDEGSFAGAAERLETSSSAVSRQVAALEKHLGVRLLNRTTRRLSLTESGQALYERGVDLLADLEETEAAIRATSLEPRGTLRLTCGVSFGTRYLAPAIAEFLQLHPQVAFDIELSDRVTDLVSEGFDLAVRIGPVGSPALVARRIGTSQSICCASAAYLEQHGTPQTPEDLVKHRCLSYTYAEVRKIWTFTDSDGVTHQPELDPLHRGNNGEMLAALAMEGLGIVMEPDFIVADAVRAGTLVRLLPDYRAPESPISAVYPTRRHLSAKVRAFVDHLGSGCAQARAWSLSAGAAL